MSFKEEYKKAYDSVKADGNSIEKIRTKAGEKREKRHFKPAFAALAVVLGLALYGGVPILAEEIAKAVNLYELGIVDYTMYKHIQRQYPEWADEFVPVNRSVSKDGVIMTVEAIGTVKKQAILFVSFANEEGYDFINGHSDYTWNETKLKTPKGNTELIQEKVLEYDEATDKLHVMYTVTSSTAVAYEDGELTFSVKGITTFDERTEELDLQNVETQPKEKTVSLPITNPKSEVVQIEGDAYPYHAKVLDMTDFQESMKDTLTITGIAYTNGMLRIQTCNGVNMVGNRTYRRCHFFQNGESEREILQEDEVLYWYKSMDGELVEFAEHYIVMSEEELRNLNLYVEYFEGEGYFDTIWSVAFEVE